MRRISVLAVLVVALVAVGRSFGIGAWAATGPTTEDLTFHGLLADEDGQPVGMFTARAAIEVAADGQTLTATYTPEFVDAGGSGTGQYGPRGR